MTTILVDNGRLEIALRDLRRSLREEALGVLGADTRRYVPKSARRRQKDRRAENRERKRIQHIERRQANATRGSPQKRRPAANGDQ